MVAYTIVLWGQTRTTLGVVSALRETGVLWAAMLGVFVFKEGRASTVIVPAAFVAIGIVLLALG
jgi:drug/metabolite transporter (DMT)-like permease